MRIGPCILGAGLLLLAGGVVSTRADAWDTRVPAVTIPLALGGIDTIDMRESGINNVVISSNAKPQVHYPGGQMYRWRGDEMPVAPPACRATGSTLQCTSGERYLPGDPSLYLPPGRYRLLLRDVSVLAKSGVESIELEVNGLVRWTGPADALVIRLAMPRPGEGASTCEAPQFAFEGGRVRSLRIQASVGELAFDHMSDVGSIEVRAAENVGLKVGKVADIARIKLLPLASTPAAANAAAPISGETREACASAARAAAMAAMVD